MRFDSTGFNASNVAEIRASRVAARQPPRVTRPHCHANDHGAFVIAPDGHDVAGVFHLLAP